VGLQEGVVEGVEELGGILESINLDFVGNVLGTLRRC